MTLVASALAVSGVLAGIALAANGVSSIIAEENTHSHTANCSIHHYAAISPTASKAGVKEYWICCNDPMHTVSFEAPTTGDITDATHPADFAVAEDDERYVAPYTFPEVFSTPWAYDTKVTIEEGKVKSQTNTIHIKGSVLKEAYSLGYTHFKFHSYGNGEDVGQILSTQDSWQKYYKRYANDNDNRFWLKSFHDANQGLNVSAHTIADGDAKGALELSNFELFKSSITESWVSGSLPGDWSTVQDCNKYIAYENGELVMDNAGSGYNKVVGAIPASLMGDPLNLEGREFYVKPLSQGWCEQNPQSTNKNDRIVVADKSGSAVEYIFQKNDGFKKETEDGFVSPVLGGYASAFGLYFGRYFEGDLTLALYYPGAIAVRTNYDFRIDYKAEGVQSVEIIPLSNSQDGLTTRTSFQNVIYTEGKDNQLNIQLPNSTKHKGMNLKMIWSGGAKPQDNVAVMSLSTSINICFPKYTEVGNQYETPVYPITFNAEEPGACIILRPETISSTPTTITFEYSWID